MSNPVPQTDAVFLKHFSQLIVALMIVAALLIALAMWVYSGHPGAENPARAVETQKRIAPVGGVHAGETGRAAIVAAEQAAKAAAAAKVAYGGTLEGSVIYANLCGACHTSGASGAPKLSDSGHWNARMALGTDTLIKHAIDGFTGSLGFMPARGGNPSLNDEQVKSTVEWMISQVK